MGGTEQEEVATPGLGDERLDRRAVLLSKNG